MAPFPGIHPIFVHPPRRSSIPQLGFGSDTHAVTREAGAGHADFDLESQRIKLDENALKIAENQEAAMKNRRKLMEATRGLRPLRLIRRSGWRKGISPC